jgi:hypothetical protein
MPLAINRSQYQTNPITSVQTAPPLADAMVRAVSAAAPPAVKKAATALGQSSARLSAAGSDRQAQELVINDNAVGADLNLDHAWAALHGRATAATLLFAEQFSQARRAQELLARLFPEGLSFLQLPYDQQLNASSTLLRRIADEKLAKEIDEVCGPEYLANVRACHEQYQVQLSKAELAPQRTNLRELLREVNAGIEALVVQVLAWADPSDPPSVAGAKAILKPLDDFRAANARKPKVSKGSSATTPKDQPQD